jgi:predicted nucleic acid-binding protein
VREALQALESEGTLVATPYAGAIVRPLSAAEASGLLKVELVTIEMHQAGIDLAERYGLSVYDAMIASAALLTECDTLFTEDLQDADYWLAVECELLTRFNRPGAG